MTILLRRVILLLLFTIVMWMVNRRRPQSFFKIICAIVLTPLIGVVTDYLFKLTFSFLGVENEVIICVVYGLLTVAMEILMILACLIIYRSFCSSNDRLLKTFTRQPKWALIILPILIISFGILYIYDNLTTVVLMSCLSSYSEFSYVSAVSVAATFAKPRPAAQICTLLRVAIVGVEAVACGMMIVKTKKDI